MFKAWLQERVTPAEAEARHMVKIDKLGPDPVPFGYENGNWRFFLSKAQTHDEIWRFTSPAEYWEKMMGRAGYSIVRDGEIVDSIVTLMN
jgi:hypothetical protein